MPVDTTAEITVDVGDAVPAEEIPLIAADVQRGQAKVFVLDGDVVALQGVRGPRRGRR